MNAKVSTAVAKQALLKLSGSILSGNDIITRDGAAE